MKDLKRIESLSDLLEILPRCSGTDFVKIADDMQIPAEELAEYAFWSDERYTRNCIDRRDHYELILLCWEEAQETPVHCHAGEECWVYTLQGNLKEERFDEGENGGLIHLQTEQMKAGELSYMNDNMGFHSLKKVGQGRAMTLHLYMNPIDRCRIYDQDKQCFEVKEMSYDSFRGKPTEEFLALAE
mgnify:CR=1 FL=1